MIESKGYLTSINLIQCGRSQEQLNTFLITKDCSVGLLKIVSLFYESKGLFSREKAIMAPLRSETRYIQWLAPHHSGVALHRAKRCAPLPRLPVHLRAVTYACVTNRNKVASQHRRKSKWRRSWSSPFLISLNCTTLVCVQIEKTQVVTYQVTLETELFHAATLLLLSVAELLVLAS